ncbi:MAG TPA: peptidase S10 [Acidimicrobiia bacterium]|nr:peptidase S10 [Acidimicrobiia bacterium]
MSDAHGESSGEETPTAPEVDERSVSKQYTGTFGARQVSYTATAATQIVDQGEDKKAVFFYVAYIEDDADPVTRPIVFAFNGGPGSSTVWLHLGLFGPRRVFLDAEGLSGGVPGSLIDNEHSILDVADVVLVDAVGTGFSTAAPKEKEKEFHHFSKDIEAFSDFIVFYLNRNGRWASPKYLAGESYGTTRAAAVAHTLFSIKHTELNGLILISNVLNFQTIHQDTESLAFHPGNDLPYMLFLPTYAATAWYHGRLSKKNQGRGLRELLDEVEEFAIGRYWSALARGDELDDKERARVRAKLAEYTGLSGEYIERYDLRIHIHRFCKEMMRDQRRTVGRLDSRFTGIDRFADGDSLENDPANDHTGGRYTATLNHYLREELGFDHDAYYETLSMKVNESWDYEEFKGRYVDTSENLRDVMSRSKGLRVFVANGYYDLATPHFATRYTFNHLGLDESLRKNVRMEHYEAGHMMYLRTESLVQLSEHLRDFVESSR